VQGYSAQIRHDLLARADEYGEPLTAQIAGSRQVKRSQHGH